LVLIDESGFSLLSPLKRSWAPKGQTSRIRTSLSHHARLSLIGALLISPGRRQVRLRIRSHLKAVNGGHIPAFLKQLLAAVAGPIVLVWDNAPIHRRRIVQEYIAQHPRLHAYHFPSYAPELNPVEFVWNQVGDHLAGRAPRNVAMLKEYAHAAVQRVRASPWRLFACLRGSALKWS
jgi:putative transposase